MAQLPEGGHGAERGRSRSHGEGNPTLGHGARRCISSDWQRRQPAVWRCASCRGRAWPGCRWQRNGGRRRQKARLPRCACAGLQCAAECAVEMSWGCGRGTRVCPRGAGFAVRERSKAMPPHCLVCRDVMCDSSQGGSSSTQAQRKPPMLRRCARPGYILIAEWRSPQISKISF